MKNIFVLESDAHYLWSGFVKKLKSLNSAGVVPQWIKAFAFYGKQCTGYTLYVNTLVQVTSVLDKCKPRGQIFVLGTFSFLFLFSTVLNTFFSPFLFF